jgi:hypothetical protein
VRREASSLHGVLPAVNRQCCAGPVSALCRDGVHPPSWPWVARGRGGRAEHREGEQGRGAQQ